MPLTLNKSDLLAALTAVSPGLSKTDTIDQSSAFAFRGGRVMTYNEDLACVTRSGLPKEFTGAVQSKPLLAILEKLEDEDLVFSFTPSRFKLRSPNGRREYGVAMEDAVRLPVDSVERPDKDSWEKLTSDFTEAVAVTHECASNNSEEVAQNAVHLTGKWVEATNDVQLIRYYVKVPVKKSVLVRKAAAKVVPQMDAQWMAETRNWVHFRNASGLLVSCQKLVGTFGDADAMELLTPENEDDRFQFPKGLAAAAERVGVFTSDTKDDMMYFDMGPDGVSVGGEGRGGEGREVVSKDPWKGTPLRFLIPPKLLVEMTRRNPDCYVGKSRLVMKGGDRWVYTAAVDPPKQKTPPAATGKTKRRRKEEETTEED